MEIGLKTASGTLIVDTDDPIAITDCKGCNARIFWAKTKNGKRMPVSTDEDGRFISHFADCPASKLFRKHEQRTKEIQKSN